MIIVFGSDKGGVGKTTITANSAVMLQQKTASVALVRTDKNEDLNTWQSLRREQPVPDIPIMTCYGSNTHKEINKLHGVTDVILVDTAGHDSVELRSALLVADVFIAPVSPTSMLEVVTLNKLSSIVNEAKKENTKLKAFALLNRCPTSPFNNDAVKITQYLNDDPLLLSPFKTRISNLKAFEKAINEGLGVHELKGKNVGSAKAQLELLFAELIDSIQDS
ncbi:ArsA-related P-loop ATPase [Xenorhabdus bovienii]|uniref:nucleotide-binding protein n=1 Tax=Xenorhabdus bovienii TaxID=40576 RepID=UPI0021571522|nr:ArsA-related P-loop ATPase [Xenorhabdus bovienii]